MKRSTKICEVINDKSSKLSVLGEQWQKSFNPEWSEIEQKADIDLFYMSSRKTEYFSIDVSCLIENY